MKILIPVIPILFILTVLSQTDTYAQKYKSTTSRVHFFSDAPVEDIEATNLDAQSAINLETGDIVFSIPIKSFTFEKSLMQEHFNENYLESDKYPRSTFKGRITDYDLSISDAQKVTANGVITIHGIENKISAEGLLTLSQDSLEINAKFPITLTDFKIKIPKVVFYNIAEIIDVTISFKYEKID